MVASEVSELVNSGENLDELLDGSVELANPQQKLDQALDVDLLVLVVAEDNRLPWASGEDYRLVNRMNRLVVSICGVEVIDC